MIISKEGTDEFWNSEYIVVPNKKLQRESQEASRFQMNVMEELKGYGLIPVTVLDDAAQAVPLAEALEQAGLPVAEITLRTQAGLAAIAAIRQAKPHFLLGAGTVRTLEQCRACLLYTSDAADEL